MHATRIRLQELTKAFNKRLTAVQRVADRFGGSKKLNTLSVEIEKAKTIKQIGNTLTGILDMLRYMVCLYAFLTRFARVCQALTLQFSIGQPSEFRLRSPAFSLTFPRPFLGGQLELRLEL